jgi:hypothetical protein
MKNSPCEGDVINRDEGDEGDKILVQRLTFNLQRKAIACHAESLAKAGHCETTV